MILDIYLTECLQRHLLICSSRTGKVMKSHIRPIKKKMEGTKLKERNRGGDFATSLVTQKGLKLCLIALI